MRALVDLNDVLTLGGVGLLCAGLWRVSPPAALIAAGLICVWYGLPPRPPFITRES
jgi:hypothetical protein